MKRTGTPAGGPVYCKPIHRTPNVPRPARRRDEAFTQFFLEKIAGVQRAAPSGAIRVGCLPGEGRESRGQRPLAPSAKDASPARGGSPEGSALWRRLRRTSHVHYTKKGGNLPPFGPFIPQILPTVLYHQKPLRPLQKLPPRKLHRQVTRFQQPFPYHYQQ